MSSHPVRKGELVQSASSRGWTIYEPDSDSLHVLNASAKAIWELSDGTISTAEMAQAISDLTQISYEEALDDVLVALDRLAGLGLVAVD